MSDLSARIRADFDSTTSSVDVEALVAARGEAAGQPDRANTSDAPVTIDLLPKHGVDEKGPDRSRRPVGALIPPDEPDPPSTAPADAEEVTGDAVPGDEVAVGCALIAAVDTGHPEVVVDLLHEDAVVEQNTARSVAEIPALLDYWELEGARFAESLALHEQYVTDFVAQRRRPGYASPVGRSGW